MSVIRNVISQSLNNQDDHKEVSIPHSDILNEKDTIDRDRLADLMKIRDVEENNFCADCGSEAPDWLSKNLSIMICKSCSGFHRSLGTHVSKVRSAMLDKLDGGLIEVSNTTTAMANEAVSDSCG